MHTGKPGYRFPRHLGFLPVAAAFVCAVVLSLGSTPEESPIPGVSRQEDGFNVDKMWEILFKSPTAYRAEMKARKKNGGRSPFAGKTKLGFSCFYPTSRLIFIPGALSDTQAALAYAYELRHFEQAEEMLGLQAQLKVRAISIIGFVDRCVKLEARAAYQQVKVARELRKAWVFGAHSDWEAYCSSSEDEQTAVGRIQVAIDSQGVVEGTGKTARGYYMWLASQKMQEAPDTAAPREPVAAGR